MNKQTLFTLLCFCIPCALLGQDKTHNPYNEKMPSYQGYNQDYSSNSISPDPTAPPTPPSPIPIDGGASFLLAAGLGYGLKELKKRQSKTNK